MTIQEMRDRLINEALYQERQAAQAGREGNAKMQATHLKAAGVLRYRANALGGNEAAK